MAFVTADRTADTTTTVGTSPLVVSGTAPYGSRTFSAVMSIGDTCYYSAQHRTLNEWEVGLATYSSANTLTRTTVYSSSNSGSAVTFSAGTKDVFITMAAARSLQLDASGNVTPAINGSYTRTTFTATAGQTSFSATYTVNYVEVYLNGILLNSADYTATTGTTVVLAAAAAAGDIVDIVAFNITGFTGGVTVTGTPASGQLAAWTSATSVQGVDSYPLWQSVQTGNFTAVAGRSYPVNTTSGAVTVTLPASPSTGQIVQVTDYAGTWATNNVTVSRNGLNINGVAANYTLNVSRGSAAFVYIDATQGWVVYSAFAIPKPNVYGGTYLLAAGGAGAPTSGAANLGGGGAGGVVTGTLPLVAGTVYSAVIGAGGAGASNGSNSSFTSLTTTALGGGAGGSPGASGGSGGGGGTSSTAPGAGTAGQGNSGGSGRGAAPFSTGGGGGAGAVGATASASAGGAGGVGVVSTLITTAQATSAAVGEVVSTSVYFGGGGGGATNSGGTFGVGGSGGGGRGNINGTNQPVNGTANTGGGGGGGAGAAAVSSGGSGVMVLSIPTFYYSGITSGSPTVVVNGSETVVIFKSSGSYTA